MADGDGTVPLRWIDIEEGTEETIIKINLANYAQKRIVALKVDPHPAWARTDKLIAFYNGTRHVLLQICATLSKLGNMMCTTIEKGEGVMSLRYAIGVDIGGIKIATIV